MPKPPSINGEGIASHENAAVCEDINNLNGLDSPKTTCRADYEESQKKAGPTYQ